MMEIENSLNADICAPKKISTRKKSWKNRETRNQYIKLKQTKSQLSQTHTLNKLKTFAGSYTSVLTNKIKEII